MNKSIFSRIQKEKDSPLGLALLFRSTPYTLSSLLSDKTLESILKKGETVLDDTSLGILKNELTFRKKRTPAPRLCHLEQESPFCFPVVFQINDTKNGIFRPAAVTLFRISAFHDLSLLGRESFSSSSADAIALADAMIPGTERPWVSPVSRELSREFDQSSGQLAFFFASMCYLLGLVYPRQVICSAQLQNGGFRSVEGIYEKARIAALDGFSYFVVAGEKNRDKAKKAIREIKGKKPKCKVLFLDEKARADSQFFNLVEQLIKLDCGWSYESIQPLIEFLFNQSRHAKNRYPLIRLEKVERIKSLLRFLNEPGQNAASDSLKLAVLADVGKLNVKCRSFEKAEESFKELKNYCNALLRKKRCPANFEDFWFAISLYQGRIATDRYQYSKAEKHLLEAMENADTHWPPSLRFQGLCRQALGRLYLKQGQTKSDLAKKALVLFKKAHTQLDPKDKPANHRYLGEAYLLAGKFSQGVQNIEEAMKGAVFVNAQATASMIRALTIWGVVKNRTDLCQKAINFYYPNFKKDCKNIHPYWSVMAKGYKALAVYHVQGEEKGIATLETAAPLNGIIKNPSKEPADLFADLWLALIANAIDDKRNFKKVQKRLENISGNFECGPQKRYFAIRVDKLESALKPKRKSLLESMLTQVQFGIPAKLFKQFVKNLM